VGINFSFLPGWWVVLLIIYSLFFVLFIARKSYTRKKELRIQFVLGLVTVVLSMFIEYVAVNSGLWTYYPQSWPAVLLLAYFGVGIAGYQIMKKVEEILSH
jgi:4-hydroxybenzoate polyprenyltransferase